ncbi:hypothetical protein [Chamaesiphon sp. VAR_69_metabat_338]|uniref:hypothetical protein n=1 Tax=Chamaesiphon sp. VAR_69_metabat_338 TaxID=2964704 RepID=UPI00286DC10A|nr:hypothetical protein [Chamaesiphon sp. VAR_69_metabat_338]
MAQFWIAIFFILLAISQLYESVKAIDLPFPIYLVLGTILAVAANPQHRFSFAPTQQITVPEIKSPAPVLTTTVPIAPILAAAATPAIAPTQVIEPIAAQQTAPVLTATSLPETPPAVVKAKKPRTPKAAPKSKSV